MMLSWLKRSMVVALVKKAGARSGEQGDGKVEKGDAQKQVTATIYDTLCY